MAIGRTVSKTETVAVAESIFPIKSVTYNFTVFNPILLQLNVVLLNEIVEIPQLSELPLLMSAFTIEAFPLASKYKVLFFVNTIGLVTSSTVTFITEETLTAQIPAETVRLNHVEVAKEPGL